MLEPPLADVASASVAVNRCMARCSAPGPVRHARSRPTRTSHSGRSTRDGQSRASRATEGASQAAPRMIQQPTTFQPKRGVLQPQPALQQSGLWDGGSGWVWQGGLAL